MFKIMLLKIKSSMKNLEDNLYLKTKNLYVDNHVGGEGEFYTALKLSQRRVHFFNWGVNLIIQGFIFQNISRVLQQLSQGVFQQISQSVFWQMFTTHPNKPDLRTLCSSRACALLKLLQSSLASAPTSATEPHDISREI